MYEIMEQNILHFNKLFSCLGSKEINEAPALLHSVQYGGQVLTRSDFFNYSQTYHLNT